METICTTQVYNYMPELNQIGNSTTAVVGLLGTIELGAQSVLLQIDSIWYQVSLFMYMFAFPNFSNEHAK